LIQVANGTLSLHEAILVEGDLGLAILPSPSCSGSMPHELVFSKALDDVFAELRRSYRMIIVDAPPLVPLVDGIARHANLSCGRSSFSARCPERSWAPC
jgi:Mrp family chromosome partitioning ATPase